MLAKLKDLGFAASYLYAYDEPVAIQPDGSWKTPDTLYLQAFTIQNIQLFYQVKHVVLHLPISLTMNIPVLKIDLPLLLFLFLQMNNIMVCLYVIQM